MACGEQLAVKVDFKMFARSYEARRARRAETRRIEATNSDLVNGQEPAKAPRQESVRLKPALRDGTPTCRASLDLAN